MSSSEMAFIVVCVLALACFAIHKLATVALAVLGARSRTEVIYEDVDRTFIAKDEVDTTAPGPSPVPVVTQTTLESSEVPINAEITDVRGQ